MIRIKLALQEEILTLVEKIVKMTNQFSQRQLCHISIKSKSYPLKSQIWMLSEKDKWQVHTKKTNKTKNLKKKYFSMNLKKP